MPACAALVIGRRTDNGDPGDVLVHLYAVSVSAPLVLAPVEPAEGRSEPAPWDQQLLCAAAAAFARRIAERHAATLDAAVAGFADPGRLINALARIAAETASECKPRGSSAAPAWYGAGMTAVRTSCSVGRRADLELAAVVFNSSVALDIDDRDAPESVVASQRRHGSFRDAPSRQLHAAWRAVKLSALRLGALAPRTPSKETFDEGHLSIDASDDDEAARDGGRCGSSLTNDLAINDERTRLRMSSGKRVRAGKLGSTAAARSEHDQPSKAEAMTLKARPQRRGGKDSTPMIPSAGPPGRHAAAIMMEAMAPPPAAPARAAHSAPSAIMLDVPSAAPPPPPPPSSAAAASPALRAGRHSYAAQTLPAASAAASEADGLPVGGMATPSEPAKAAFFGQQDPKAHAVGVEEADMGGEAIADVDVFEDDDDRVASSAASDVSDVDSEAAIDQLFADLETAVKYLGELLHAALRPPSRPLYAVPVGLRAAAALLAAVVVTVVVVLPTFFAVLAVRMVKVETSKESFVKRAAIIAAETVAQHTARLGRLAMRAFPLVALLWGVPPAVCFGVLPALSCVADQATAALATAAVLTGLVTVLQIQGTVRAAVTHRASGEARAKTHAAAARVLQGWWRRCKARELPKVEAAIRQLHETGLLSPVPSTRSSGAASAVVAWPDAAPDPDGAGGLDAALVVVIGQDLPDVAVFEPPPPPAWHRNIAVYIAAAVDAVQVALFGAQFLFIAPDSPFDVGALPPWLARLIPYALFTFPDPSLVRPWIAVGAVGAAVVLIVGRLLYEVVAYHRAVRSGRPEEQAAGEAAFFHGFTGSVLYGHGNPRAVPAGICTAAQLLCDTLFFSVVGSLTGSLGCFDATGPSDVVFGTDAACFSSQHLRSLSATLTAFGYYVPLAILVAPVLAEANKPAAGGCVATVKPFTMATNVLKCVAVLAAAFASRKVWAGVGCGVALSVSLVVLSGVWGGATRLAQPTTSARMNLGRTLTGVGAVAVSVLAALAAAEDATGLGAVSFVIGATVSLGLADVVGPVATLCLVPGGPA